MQENQPMQTAYLVLSNSGIVNFDWNLMVCEGWVQLDTKVNHISYKWNRLLQKIFS